jgi:hypothetical protein
MLFKIPAKPLISTFDYTKTMTWYDPYHCSFRKPALNLKIAEDATVTWKKMTCAADLAALLDVHPHFGICVNDMMSYPAFIHTLSYDRETELFAGINGSALDSKPIHFKLPDSFFDTEHVSLKDVTKSVLYNFRQMRRIHDFKCRPSTADAADDVIKEDVKIASDDVTHELHGTLLPPCRDFLSTYFKFKALELGIEHAEFNVFHHSIRTDPPEPDETDADDHWVLMPGFCLVPPFLVADFIKMSTKFQEGDRLAGIGPTAIIPWLLARCDEVATYTAASSPNRLLNFRILIHWLIVWLDFAFSADFPQLEVIEFVPEDTSVYILSRLPVSIQDQVAAVFFSDSA